MKIRAATADDAPALGPVHVDSWRAAYRGLVPDARLDALDCERRAQSFRQWLEDADSAIFVTECAGRVVGFLTLGASRDADVDPKVTGEVMGIYLDPDHWRQGLGGTLCRHAENVLSRRGYTQVTLWVFAGNPRARRFYEAMGFEPDGASRELNVGAPLEAVRYRKALADGGT